MGWFIFNYLIIDGLNKTWTLHIYPKPSVFVWHGITEGVYPWGDSNVTLPQEIRENKTAMIGLIVNNKRNHLSGPGFLMTPPILLRAMEKNTIMPFHQSITIKWTFTVKDFGQLGTNMS